MDRVEHPLDVLTIAAAMMDSTRHREASIGAGTTMPLDSIGKILPTREQRHKRIHDSYYSGTPTGSSCQGNKKSITMATQTPFSSFDEEETSTDHRPTSQHPTATSLPIGGSTRPMTLPIQPVKNGNTNLNPWKAQSYKNSPFSQATGRYPIASPTSPLNLSISSSLTSTSDSTLSGRPSVITSANNDRRISESEIENARNQNSVSISDPDIDEHFRRSLGRSYFPSAVSSHSAQNSPKSLANSPPQHMQSRMSPCYATPPPPSTNSPHPVEVRTTLGNQTVYGEKQQSAPRRLSNADITTTESVDDHFAKSLGDRAWSEIKRDLEPVNMEVDEHFKKALGDKWNMIQKSNSKTLSPSTSPQIVSQNGHTLVHKDHHFSSNRYSPAQ